jgi:pimeloyl-ACP methyl ester carboxylesterase
MLSITKSAPSKPFAILATDGTSLSYYRLGNKDPSLIVLPGAMSSALSQLELATALSPDYTVYLFSRRSRGLSGPYPTSITSFKNPLSQNNTSCPSAAEKSPNPSPYPVYDPTFSAQVLYTDLDDLATLMRHTNSSILLGISGGALLMLAALLPSYPVPMPPITKAVIFEPPFLIPSSLSSVTTPQHSKPIDLSLIRRYEQEIADNDTAAALVTAMKTVQLGPGWMALVPRWIIKGFSKMIMNSEKKEQAKKIAAGGTDDGAVTMEALAPVLRYDFALGEAMVGEPERFAEIETKEGREILLLGGEVSMGYIKEGLGVLEGVMCGEGRAVRRAEVKGVGHELFENKARNGKVEMGVGVVRKFLEEGVVAFP